MAARADVGESPALLRDHILRQNAWQEVWRANADERKRLSAAQRLSLHAPEIQKQVVEAPDNSRSFWDSALFAIDCLVQAIHDGIGAASGADSRGDSIPVAPGSDVIGGGGGGSEKRAGGGAPRLLRRGSLIPPDFQATIAAVISRTEGVRDGLSVRCAFVGVVRGVLSDVVVPDIEESGPSGSVKRLERFGLWWDAFKVFSEFTRRFLQYHDRDTVPSAADSSSLLLLPQSTGTGSALGQGSCSESLSGDQTTNDGGSGDSCSGGALAATQNAGPPQVVVESLSATSIRAWCDLVFVPLVREDSAFLASLWGVIRRDRDEGSEGSAHSTSLVQNVVESAQVCLLRALLFFELVRSRVCLLFAR